MDAKEVADNAKAVASGQDKSAAIAAAGNVTSAAITGASNILGSKAVLGLAAAAGYKKVLDKAGEYGEIAGDKIGTTIGNALYGDPEMDAKIAAATAKYADAIAAGKARMEDYMKFSNIGQGGVTTADKRAVYIANCLKSGTPISNGNSETKSAWTPEQGRKFLSDRGYVINDDGVVNRGANWDGGKIVTGVGGAAASAGVGAAASGAGASGAGAAGATATTGTTIFGMSLATIGWIAAGVAAAAIITPYIYDKIRACTKTWGADIIAEVKFKADGKSYRCFYDLDDNKWVLTYANIKWTSYLDNKLDKETQEEFFASNFFKKFLDKCRQTFAFLFSTGKNEVVFKTLPEIKDAPKELKDILEKIYDNKGAITKNLFTGNH